MARRIVILGASTFSRNVIRYLHRHGRAEVVVVDRSEARINSIAHLVSRPIIGDVCSYELLQQLELDSADCVVVSLGDLEASLICVLYLRDLEAPPPIVKALNSGHARLLRLLGLHDVVFPQKLAADMTAIQLLHPRVRHAIDLDGGRYVVEIEPDRAAIGQSLGDLKHVRRIGIRPILILNRDSGELAEPEAHHVFRAGDTVVVYATEEQLHQIDKAFET